MSIARIIAAIGLAAFLGSHCHAAEIDFNRDIRPLLNTCLTCHGPDEEERAADLRLDTQEGSRADLGGYSAIKPGDPDVSEMIVRVLTDDPDLHMPPQGKGRELTPEEISLIRQWIREGANYAKHWAYELPVRSSLPKVKRSDWPRNSIDYFTLAKIEQAGLEPSPPAARLALARRVALDLTGLPPTWEEASKFAADKRDNAYEFYVDQQLAKPAFGERWARVWLDLARYADSAGYADDPARTIWAFRDYVIRSLNANKPFDQFTIEQIAGDLLDNPTQEQLVATAFHRNTLTNNEGGTNDEEFRNVAVVDRVNTTMAVWMGTTMACAQCHTHKYDPITHDEYFQFFAFFNNSEDADRRNESPIHEIWLPEQEAQKETWRKRIAELKKIVGTPTPELAAAQKRWMSRVNTPPSWELLKAKSAEGKHRKLGVSEDWIAAEGDKPDNDQYTIKLATKPALVTGLRLEVPAEQKGNFVLTNVSASWAPPKSNAVEARYVRVELSGKGKMIHLAELQAFSGDKNVATSGKATASSTAFGGPVERINDGNTNGDFSGNSVNHTAIEENPWVEIDLGSTQPINRVGIWNRTDGGTSILSRLTGYKVLLLDAERKVAWEQSPKSPPMPSDVLVPDGSINLNFSSAIADFEQKGFTAQSAIAKKTDKKKGWAIAPQTGKPHELILMLAKPVKIEEGDLTIRIQQDSIHKKTVLDKFRFALTTDSGVAEWARMPADVRELVRKQDLNDKQRSRVAAYYRTVAPILAAQRKELATVEKKLASIKPKTTVPIMRQLSDDKKRTTKVQIRGNYLSTGHSVSEGTPAIFHPLPNGEKRDRLALAKWLIDEKNPLTARVIANRHWEQIFGTGIVLTSEEFGSQGDLPSHPKLLDWLAVELRESGWDIKAMLKLLVMSATYRQSSVTSAEMQESDPFNRLLVRGPRFRVSAEMVRDQVLFVSGLMSPKMFGPPVKPPQPELGLKAAFGSATDWQTSAGEDRYRRGLYTTWRRSSPYPSMAQFDAPNREVCTVRRIRTNTPLQALVTLNDPVFVEAAQALARNMIAVSESDAERITYAFRQTLTRMPSDLEIQRLSELVANAKKHFLADTAAAKKMATEPIGKLPEDVSEADAAAWTVVGNVILNLDEMFLKR